MGRGMGVSVRAEIIAVGTELLLGDIVNTNAQFLSQELAALGISVYHQSVVGDNPQRLFQAFQDAYERRGVQLVITSGGLGPTKDDLTKDVAARFFGLKMEVHPESLAHIRAIFSGLGVSMTENDEKPATLPRGARALFNNNGTAPGIFLRDSDRMLIMLPGPPQEMLPMFRESVVPLLAEVTGRTYYSKTLRICGIGESRVEDVLADIFEGQSNPTIAPYAKTFETHLRITADAPDTESALALIEPVSQEIYKRLGVGIYGEDDTTLEAAVCAILEERGLSLALAESCTGGMVASRIVDHPGASAVLRECVVAYSNHAKEVRLGVRKETLQAFSAVSEEVAREMAEGAAMQAGADIGLAVTGVAGPGDSEGKPAGLVYIAVAVGGRVFTTHTSVKGSRQRVRTRATVLALDFLRRCVIAPEPH